MKELTKNNCRKIPLFVLMSLRIGLTERVIHLCFKIYDRDKSLA